MKVMLETVQNSLAKTANLWYMQMIFVGNYTTKINNMAVYHVDEHS